VSAASAGAASSDLFSLEGVEAVDDFRAEPEYLFKLLLVGDSGVGKSALVKRFADGEYSPSFISTIGVDFKIATLRIDGKLVKLQIWDTAGQERFRAITSSYYRGAHGIACVYDCSDETTLHSVKRTWLEEARRYGRPDAGLMLVGNKSDLRASTSEWGEEDEAAAIASAHGMTRISTSAKTDNNVDAAFIGLARKLMRDKALSTRPTAPVLPTPGKDLGTTRTRSSLLDCCRVS
jgi:Ras-related protein Rab-1A